MDLHEASADQSGTCQCCQIPRAGGAAPSRDCCHSHGQHDDERECQSGGNDAPPGQAGRRGRTEIDVATSQEDGADSRRDGHQTGNDTDVAGGGVSRVASIVVPG